MIRRGNITRPRFSFGGQPILDIDDSSNHSTGVTLDYDEDSQSQQPSTTMSNSESGSYIHGLFVPDRPRRVQRPLTKSNHEDNINLNACLDHLFRILSRKDKEGFFQYPVTDQVRPYKRKVRIRINLSMPVCSRLFSNHHEANGFFNNEEKNYSG